MRQAINLQTEPSDNFVDDIRECAAQIAAVGDLLTRAGRDTDRNRK